MSDKSSVATIPQRLHWGGASEASEKVIAVLTPSYGLERMTYLIPSHHHRYVRLSRIPLHRLERRGTFFNETPYIVGGRADLIHTFNQLPLNRRFVVSAEMELPRYLEGPAPWQMRVGYDILASERCRGIWPMSEAAHAYIARRLDRAGRGEAIGKMQVFRGAVASVPGDAPRADPEYGPLRLLFVGGDGLRKGLGPTLEACRRLRAGGVELQLTVVGGPAEQTYLVPGARFDTGPIQAALKECEWIRHQVSVPNRVVRRMMTEHDIFLFPTMDESLGWVVAEAALSGMPTLATNIFALPELVRNGETGWIVDLPLDEDRRWFMIGRRDARAAWDESQRQIADRMTAILAAIAADRQSIHVFGKRAQAHIGGLYGVDVAGAALDRLYTAAMQ